MCFFFPHWWIHRLRNQLGALFFLGQRPEPGVSFFMQLLRALLSAFDMLLMFTCTLQMLAEVQPQVGVRRDPLGWNFSEVKKKWNSDS